MDDRTAAVVEDLRRLVEIESPSGDDAGLRACADALADLVERRLGSPARVDASGQVDWSKATGPDQRPVLILGHLDTVWPRGTLQRLPFDVGGDGRVTGPGTFDMKAGLVVAIHALAALGPDAPPARLLVTADEETGSIGSRAAIEDAARACGRVLVLEPSGPGGAVKTARKGVAILRGDVTGRASHAGLAPEDGINAAVALARLVPQLEGLGDGITTVTPTLVTAGTTMNTVPAHAEVQCDVRFLDGDEPERLRADLAALDAGPAEVAWSLHVNRPPLEPSASAPLLDALHLAAAQAGVVLDTVAVGGASDGNLAAAVGAYVLDGLGPAGGGAHADDEHVRLEGLVPRVRLLEELLPRVAAVPAPDGL